MRNQFQIILAIVLVMGIRAGFGQIPTITSFTPASGPIGTSVTITGTNFDPTPSKNIVYFGATQGAITESMPTQLKVIVPTGATYQPPSVTVNGLTAYSTTAFVVTFSGDGGSFSKKIDFATGGVPGPYPSPDVAIGDLDQDGKSDLAVNHPFSNTVSVLRNTSRSGAITATAFAPAVQFTTGEAPVSIAIADLDGDGKIDLVVPNFGANTISIFKNTSTTGAIDANSFAAKVDFTTRYEPRNVAISDLDGDGKPDLAVVNVDGVSVFRNTSTIGVIDVSSFAEKVDFNLTTGYSPSSNVAIGDLDGDGKPDLAVADYDLVSILKNTSTVGVITFATNVNFTTGGYANSIAIGDLDGDSKSDLAVVTIPNLSGGNTVSIFRNTSVIGEITASTFAAKVDFVTGEIPIDVEIGDLDGDGKPDLAIVNQDSYSVSVFKNTSNIGSISTSSFTEKKDYYFITDNPNNVAIGDLDGDSRPDLAVTITNKSAVSILHNEVNDQITGIDNLEHSVGLFAYPNPVGSDLMVELKGLKISEPLELTVYNLSGKMVLRKTLISANNILPVDQLPSGIYLIVVANQSYQFIKK